MYDEVACCGDNNTSLCCQDNNIELDERSKMESLFRLNLYGQSPDEAMLMLHTRLSQLATVYYVGSNNLFKEIWQTEGANNGRVRSLAKTHGLVVVVGKGLHSEKRGHDEDDNGDLGGMVEELFTKVQLPCRRYDGKQGRVVVSGHDLASWLEEQKQSHQQHTVQSSAIFRIFMLGVCSCSVASIFFVVPNLLRYGTTWP